MRRSTDPQFAFVAGLHRSGTSLLFKCLRNHPDISGFRNTGVPENEGQHLQTVYPPASAYGGPGRFGFDPRAHLTEQSELVSQSSRDRLFAEWSRYWDLSKRVLLEKSPPNLIRMRFLQALFPGSRFIVLLRHPVAVSFATQKMSDTPLASLIEHWLVCHERFQADRSHLQHVLVLRYEDLVAAPQKTLDDVYDFLELERQPVRMVIRPDSNDRYLAKLGSSTIDGDLIRQRYRDRITRFGYECDSLPRALEAC